MTETVEGPASLLDQPEKITFIVAIAIAVAEEARMLPFPKSGSWCRRAGQGCLR